MLRHSGAGEPGTVARVPGRIRRVAVLGLGLIGGSLLQAIDAAGLETVGYDLDPATAAAASASGYAVASNDGRALAGADLVILAMPLPEVTRALRSAAGHLTMDTVVTDVGTLKAPVLSAVRAIVPGVRFVGGHPLAGTENSGWDAADPLLFRDAPWALTLESDTPLESWLEVAELVCDLGGKPVPTTAADQDAAVARVIGLPHVLAEVLALTGLAGGPLGLSLAAGSYLSGSRVARTRPDLVATWCDHNPALVGALEEVIRRLVAARDALGADRSMLDLAVAGHRARMDWEDREFEQVELSADPETLRRHGRDGGWITAVLREQDVRDGPRLLGMRPLT
jgi:prephenate dehydrogenase